MSNNTMFFIEKESDIEKLYFISLNIKKLEKVLNIIVREYSYRSSGTFVVPKGIEVDLDKNLIVSGACLPNGDPMFENIQSITPRKAGGYCIVATKVTSPQLASIIKGILAKNPNSINELINYRYSEELVPLEDKITKADEDVTAVSNFNFEEKTAKLKTLKALCAKKNKGEYFDTVSLSKYSSLIEKCYVNKKILYTRTSENKSQTPSVVKAKRLKGPNK